MTTDGRAIAARRGAFTYLTLLGIQSVAATALLWTVFPLFQQIMTQPGQPGLLDPATAASAIAAMVVMQVCYWTRYHHVPLWVPVHSTAAGHVLMFASRASFFFGGALFTAIFFRHVPQLDALPPLGQSIAKAIGIMALLFALFCYSLELERLGRAIEERAEKAQ